VPAPAAPTKRRGNNTATKRPRRGTPALNSRQIEAPKNNKRAFTVQQAAAALGVKPQTLYAWKQQDVGPVYYKQGNRVYYPQDAFERWLLTYVKEGRPHLEDEDARARIRRHISNVLNEIAAEKPRSLAAFLRWRAAA
jgi:hypothetical protein